MHEVSAPKPGCTPARHEHEVLVVLVKRSLPVRANLPVLFHCRVHRYIHGEPEWQDRFVRIDREILEGKGFKKPLSRNQLLGTKRQGQLELRRWKRGANVGHGSNLPGQPSRTT